MNIFHDLFGKSALVTGASSGIGEHFSRTLAAAGVNVVLSARRTKRLEQITSDINASGGEASWIQLNVTDKSNVEAAFQGSKLPSVEDWILSIKQCWNCFCRKCSGYIRAALGTMSLTRNLKGAWLVAQQAGLCMSADSKGGSLINIASILGRRVDGWSCTLFGGKKQLWIIWTTCTGLRVGALQHTRECDRTGLHHHRHQPGLSNFTDGTKGKKQDSSEKDSAVPKIWDGAIAVYWLLMPHPI